MNLLRRDQTGREQSYYDHLSYLFEKVAWVTILWALIVNILSPLDQTTKIYIGLIVLVASVFNFVYFRYIYLFINKAEFRFFVPELFFPFFIWIFVHLHHDFTAFLLLPYYILIMATSLTLRRIDVLLALGASLFFVILETIVLHPFGSSERGLGGSQVAALLIFSWVALKLAEHVKIQRGETGNIIREVLEEEKKTTLLKEYTSRLVVDRQKAQILVEEFSIPVLVLDSKSKILETNKRFQDFSDFKNNSLNGKDIGFVLRLPDPLNFEGKSYVPESFEGILLTRRGREKTVTGRAHYLLGRDRRLKEILILLTQVA